MGIEWDHQIGEKGVVVVCDERVIHLGWISVVDVMGWGVEVCCEYNFCRCAGRSWLYPELTVVIEKSVRMRHVRNISMA